MRGFRRLVLLRVVLVVGRVGTGMVGVVEVVVVGRRVRARVLCLLLGLVLDLIWLG
jgi:hypothetical protein